MEEKAINKKITIGIIALILVVLAIVGATYAYFSTTHSTDEHTVTTGKLSMGFSEGDILNATGLIPIEDSEIKTKAMELPFSVTNTGSEHMKLTIELTNIVMDDELKDTDFRWGIYNEDTNVGQKQYKREGEYLNVKIHLTDSRNCINYIWNISFPDWIRNEILDGLGSNWRILFILGNVDTYRFFCFA